MAYTYSLQATITRDGFQYHACVYRENYLYCFYRDSSVYVDIYHYEGGAFVLKFNTLINTLNQPVQKAYITSDDRLLIFAHEKGIASCIINPLDGSITVDTYLDYGSGLNEPLFYWDGSQLWIMTDKNYLYDSSLNLLASIDGTDFVSDVPVDDASIPLKDVFFDGSRYWGVSERSTSFNIFESVFVFDLAIPGYTVTQLATYSNNSLFDSSETYLDGYNNVVFIPHSSSEVKAVEYSAGAINVLGNSSSINMPYQSTILCQDTHFIIGSQGLSDDGKVIEYEGGNTFTVDQTIPNTLPLYDRAGNVSKRLDGRYVWSTPILPSGSVEVWADGPLGPLPTRMRQPHKANFFFM